MRAFLSHTVTSLVVCCLCSATACVAQAAEPMRVTTFCSDITPPLGEALFCGDPLRVVEEPLLAKGIVLEVEGQRYVLCAFDWCELCNGGYDLFRAKIAEAAGTLPSHVAVQTVHPHTAPLIDTDAQKLLVEVGAERIHLDLKALDDIVQRLTAAIKLSLDKFESFDRIGASQAKVDRVASTRRCRDEAGKFCGRGSSCKDPAIRALPEGNIDPYLKTITFARGEKPLARLHYYATHPQSRYGDNRATSDFAGIARETLQKKEGVFQIYFNGCGGDVAAGKYNDASDKCRQELTERLLAGMEASVAATKLGPVGAVQWHTYPLMLPRRSDAGFTVDSCLAVLKDPKSSPVEKLYRSAMRAVSLRRADQPIELTSLQIGDIHIVHLPGEPMVEFQHFAQGIKPDSFVAVAGYGDGATGYICTKKAFEEGGYEPTVSIGTPESEFVLKKAIATLLGGSPQ